MFLSSADLKKNHSGIPSNSIDPDLARRFIVGPDLSPNCLQRLSAEDKKRYVRLTHHYSCRPFKTSYSTLQAGLYTKHEVKVICLTPIIASIVANRRSVLTYIA